MKTKLAALALLPCLFASSIVLADICPRFYLGAEILGTKSKVANQYADIRGLDDKPFFKKKDGGLAPIVGVNFNECFGLELGAVFLSEQEQSATFTYNGRRFVDFKVKTKTRNTYLDALGYLPVCEDIDLIGALGAGRLTTTVKASEAVSNVAGSYRTTKTGIRAGIGGRYKFTDCFNARLMFRYQKGNKIFKTMNSVGLGLFYEF